MIIKQISIFMENTTGRLADVTALLAQAGINLRAISIADTTDFGILRMVADQPDEAVKLLKEQGFTARETDVIAVEVPDHPGELARIMARKYGDQSFKQGEEQDPADEMADVLWVLLCLANQTGVDLTEAFHRNLEKKTNRDKDRHKNNPKL